MSNYFSMGNDDPRIRLPCFQICNIVDGRVTPITEGFGTQDGKNIISENYRVGDTPYDLVPITGAMSAALKRGEGEVLLIQLIEFSPENYEYRFSEEGKWKAPYLTDYDNEQTVYQDYGGVMDCRFVARKVLLMIDLKTGSPMTNCYQYPPNLFCYNDLVKNYDRNTHILTMNTPRIFTGRFSNGPRKAIQTPVSRSKSGKVF